MPIYAEAKVHRDYHIQVDRALYSIPEHLRGQTVSVRADGELVKAFHGGKLVKTHPRQPAGGRCTDPADLPADKTGYAMRDLTRLIATAAGHGADIGIYAERLLDHQLPWTRMRQVYRLLGWSNATARPGEHRLRAGIGARCGLGVQDRRDAAQGHREHPSRGAAAATGLAPAGLPRPG
ncbi:tnp domain protein [Mycobacterium xenopi 3993]|nr:tnp domain protein [Mycobacterium xenopi 3993]